MSGPAIDSVVSVSACQSRRSSKDVLDLLEQPAIVGARRRFELLRRQNVGELLQELALLARQFARRQCLDGDEKIAAPAPRYVGHPLAAQPEERASGCSVRNLERLGLAADGRDLDFAAQRQRREVDRDLAGEI